MSDGAPPAAPRPPTPPVADGAELPDRIELNQGDAILVLDGNVLEVFFHDAMLTRHWHVNHVMVDAKPNRKGDRMKFVLGINIRGTMMDPLPFEVPVADQAATLALFAEAMRRRALSAQSSTGGSATSSPRGLSHP